MSSEVPKVKKCTTFKGGLTVGYVRIDYPSNSFSIDEAKQTCFAIAEKNALKIDIVISDEGQSGINMDRKGIKWICNNLAIINNIVAVSLSRISRDVHQINSFMTMIENNNIKLYCREGIFHNADIRPFKPENQLLEKQMNISFESEKRKYIVPHRQA